MRNIRSYSCIQIYPYEVWGIENYNDRIGQWCAGL